MTQEVNPRSTKPRYLHRWVAKCPYCGGESTGGFYVGNADSDGMSDRQAVAWHSKHMGGCPQAPSVALPRVLTSVFDTHTNQVLA